FLQFDTSIRSVVCTTNAVESINARIRRAVNARGHFPTDAALPDALAVLNEQVAAAQADGSGGEPFVEEILEFRLSMLLVVQITLRISLSKARKGTNSAQAFSHSLMMA
ncbi:transposase, partial [Mycobacterium heckeshornense]|uniref:transposase n=1 Tax=Mycobacterium heckeshornense TaxID=110505 RepID=UPI0021F32670